MRIALFLDHRSTVVDPGRAEKARDVEDIGEPIDLDPEVAFELVGKVLRQISVGALVVGICCDGSWFGHMGLLSFCPPLGYNA
jgi:hypothetical protein